MEDKTYMKIVPEDGDTASAESYPGVAVDIADDNTVDEKLVAERTDVLGNNPRNNDIDN